MRHQSRSSGTAVVPPPTTAAVLLSPASFTLCRRSDLCLSGVTPHEYMWVASFAAVNVVVLELITLA